MVGRWRLAGNWSIRAPPFRSLRFPSNMDSEFPLGASSRTAAHRRGQPPELDPPKTERTRFDRAVPSWGFLLTAVSAVPRTDWRARPTLWANAARSQLVDRS